MKSCRPWQSERTANRGKYDAVYILLEVFPAAGKRMRGGLNDHWKTSGNMKWRILEFGVGGLQSECSAKDTNRYRTERSDIIQSVSTEPAGAGGDGGVAEQISLTQF